MKVNIIKFDHFGRGIGKIDKKIVFVDKALPNEIVDISLIKEKKNYYEGKINNILEESKKRIKPICPYYDNCGGCQFLHTTYDIEKEFKINKACELLGKCDYFYETKDLNYRNKVTLHISNNKLGFYEEKTNKIIEIDYCYLLNDHINRVISDLKRIDLSKYDFKNIIIKTNLNKTLLYFDNKVDNIFLDNFNYVDTIICNDKVVKGDGFITEIIYNKVFKITPKAFFQVNREGLENIYQIITSFLKDKNINKALDLYSGTSLWSILISDYVKKITGIEINEEAVLNAKDNIKNNNISNVKVINGDVKDYLNEFKDIDLVIVDPPRSGLSKLTREYLKTINSHYFIYVSCDMQTLKRDLEDLKNNYDILNINIVDMFKRTYHVESVCLLCRKTVDK